MFHICLHPDLHDAFSSRLCSVMPRDKMECDNREGKRQISCWSRFQFRRVADCRVSALLCAAEEAQPSWKTGCTCCSQTLNALLMPSFGLYACTYQGIALSISPSGLRGFAPTQSLYAHMHMQRRNSGECRLTVLGTYACMFGFFFYRSLSPSLHSFLPFQSTEIVKLSSFPMVRK